MVARLIAALAVLLLAGAGYYLFFSSGGEETASLLRPDDPIFVAEGQEIYASTCAACHGADGEGQPGWETASAANPLAPPHDGTGHTWQHPDTALFELTKTGLSTVACRTLNSEAMPKFGETLSDEQIVAVLSYIKSRWPESVRKQNAAINRIYATQTN
jgi:mono/diheme cytochrome c family protein